MHADLHPGNLVLLPGGRLGMLNFGAAAAPATVTLAGDCWPAEPGQPFPARRPSPPSGSHHPYLYYLRTRSCCRFPGKSLLDRGTKSITEPVLASAPRIILPYPIIRPTTVRRRLTFPNSGNGEAITVRAEIPATIRIRFLVTTIQSLSQLKIASIRRKSRKPQSAQMVSRAGAAICGIWLTVAAASSPPATAVAGAVSTAGCDRTCTTDCSSGSKYPLTGGCALWTFGA
jgi:hypothetical protein